MPKIDYKKELKHLYGPSTKDFVIVEVPEMNFLTINGTGDPNTAQSFQEAIEALYSLSYALKFIVKKSGKDIDYVVMPLEGLWWTDDMSKFSINNKKAWKWTLMIMQPAPITKELVDKARAEVMKKKQQPALLKVRFKSYKEGLSAQIMHTGPFSAEGPTIRKLHSFITGHGHKIWGKHHEIYLSDFRKTKPDKLRTVLRQPIK